MPVVQDEISLVKVANGDDGRGILGTPVATYSQSTSGTTPPTSWSATRPNVPAGQYLWTRVVTTYTDNTTSETQTPTLMGAEGESGLGIKDKSISYAVGTSGNTPPTSGWQETIPTVSASQYLWTKTTLVYTDESKTEAYSVGKMGANGADAKLLYLTASAENMAFNADDTPKTTQTINISAKLQNVTGTATFAAIPYIGNTAQTAITLGGTGNTRTLTSAQWTNKNWTLIAITATLDNLSDTLSIVKVKDGATGDKGDQGNQGIPGTPGADGKTPYTHWAYAWSADGKDRFTSSYPIENILIGTTSDTQTLTTNSGWPDKTGATNALMAVGADRLVKAGDTITYSAFITAPADVRAYIYVRLNRPGASNGSYEDKTSNRLDPGTSGWCSVTVTVPSDTTSLRFTVGRYENSNAVTRTLSWASEKAEKSDKRTIYTPSPADDFANAYPTYVGTYTDYEPTDSEDPSKYTWQRILGESGQDGKDGEQGPQGVPGPKGDNGQTYYTWLKYAETPTSGMSDSPTGKSYIGLAYNKASATESTNYADYTWSLIKGSDGAQGPKGDNGQTLYTWIKYATSATGAGMSDSPTGKTYIGLAYNKTTATESTNAADYTWSLIKGDKGDPGATGPQGPQGPTGPKGDRGIMGVAYMQPTQPNDTTEGATWFQTESSTSDKIIAVYTYKSGWQKKKYASATLAVESLDALSANLGEITAGIINGVEIRGDGLYSDFDVNADPGGTNRITGRLSMANGKFRNDYQYKDGSGAVYRNGFMALTHEALQMTDFTGSQTATPEWFMQIAPTGLTLQNRKGQGGTLGFQDLYSLDKTGLMPTSGYSQYSNSSSSANYPCAVRVGRIVNLAGAFTNNSSFQSSATEVQMGVLPIGFRPAQDQRFVVQGSSMNRFLLVITTDGKIMHARYGTDSYATIPANAWLNISCVYAAADV